MSHRRALAFVDRFGPRIYLLIVFLLAISSSILYYKAVNLSHAIQNERRDTIRRECQTQNRNHDVAVETLNKLLLKSGVPKSRQEASRKFTVKLINALSPVQDCDHIVAVSTKTGA